MTIPLWPHEVDLLRLINGLHHLVLDALMYSISNPIVWTPVLCMLVYYLLVRNDWREGLLLILCLGLCIITIHLVGNVWAKPYFARIRPTLQPGLMEHLHLVYGYTARSYSFFSGHAANFVGSATLLILAVRRRWHTAVVYTLVALVAYSRLYQGVHYVSDVVVGAIVGAMLGYMIYRLYAWLRLRLLGATRPSYEALSGGYRMWLTTLIVFLPLLGVLSWQVATIIKHL